MKPRMDLNAVDTENRNALHLLCQYNTTEHLESVIKLLIENGIDLNAVDIYNQNALHYLCKYNTSDHLKPVIKLVIETGIDLNAVQMSNWNALHFLCSYNTSGHLKCVIELLIESGIDINAVTKYERNALHFLCRYNTSGHLKSIIELLIEHGIDINAVDNDNWNALHFLCQNNTSDHLVSIVELFIENGIDLNAVIIDNLNALHFLCYYNTSDKLKLAIELLIGNGIDLNVIDIKKWNALHCLCRYNRSDYLISIMELMVDNGIDLNAVDTENRNALHLLCQFNTSDHLKSAVELLIGNGIDLNAVNHDNSNALHLLCRNNTRDSLKSVIELLIENGIDLNSLDVYNWNALHFLCLYNTSDHLKSAIELAIENGIDLNAVDIENWNPLHCFCKSSTNDHSISIIQLLITNGVDLCTVNKHKQNPLHILFRYSTVNQLNAITRLLIANGIDLHAVDSFGHDLLHLLLRYPRTNLHSLFEMLTDEGREVNMAKNCNASHLILAKQIGCFHIMDLLASKTERETILERKAEMDSRTSSFCSSCWSRKLQCVQDDVFDSKVEVKTNGFNLTRYNKAKIRNEIKKNRQIAEKCHHTHFMDGARKDIQLPNNVVQYIQKWKLETLSYQDLDHLVNSYSHARDCQEHCNWCDPLPNLESFLKSVFRVVAMVDPRYNVKALVHCGSSKEKTNILIQNEWDYLVIFHDFRQSETETNQVNYFGDEQVDSLCFDGSISSGIFLFYFHMILAEITRTRICFDNFLCHNVALNETCVTLELIYSTETTAPMEMSVDLSIAIESSDSDLFNEKIPEWYKGLNREKKPNYLVAYRKEMSVPSSWQISASSLESDLLLSAGQVVRGCYCILKMLAIFTQKLNGSNKVNRKTHPSSYTFKSCLLHYMDKYPPPWRLEDRLFHCIGICQLTIHKKDSLCNYFTEKPVEIGHQEIENLKDILNHLNKMAFSFISSY